LSLKYNKYPKYPLSVDTTTIKVGRKHKRRFDRLQASFTLLSGKKITQAELMEMLLAAAEASTKPLSEVKWRPATGRELERIMALPMDFGTGEGDVDEVLYGKKRRPRR